MASKWQSLGLALFLDDDQLDKIPTSNETDEACLREMLELYMLRSDVNHSWEEIEGALKIKHESAQEVHHSTGKHIILNISIIIINNGDSLHCHLSLLRS